VLGNTAREFGERGHKLAVIGMLLLTLSAELGIEPLALGGALGPSRGHLFAKRRDEVRDRLTSGVPGVPTEDRRGGERAELLQRGNVGHDEFLSSNELRVLAQRAKKALAETNLDEGFLGYLLGRLCEYRCVTEADPNETCGSISTEIRAGFFGAESWCVGSRNGIEAQRRRSSNFHRRGAGMQRGGRGRAMASDRLIEWSF
jgi:hypothetical protein